jgi:hypothetical protein
MRIPAVVVGLLGAALASGAQAAPGSAFATPSTLTASLQSTLPTTLVWTVRFTFGPTAAQPALTFISSQGAVSTPGGQVLQVDAVPVTVQLPAKLGQGSAAETFTLAPSTVAAALRLGVNTLFLKRTFVSGNLAVLATATIALGGSASGPLTLSRVMLHFDDRSLVRVVRVGESAVAVAEITFAGNGVLSGLWEVASPPSTLGEPVFVPLGAASINLAAGGLSEVTSPALPAAAAGTYYVRFRVRSPVVPFDSLVLRYAVEAGSAQVVAISLISPEPHATLNSDTRFAWQPAPDAVAYRLELYHAGADAADSQPVSGLWLPGEQRNALLSALAQTHLRAGQAYQWRVVALNSDSEVVGRSALYEIRTP